MRLNTTGIAARMMLSLDKKAIGEKLINGRQINPTPLQVRYPTFIHPRSWPLTVVHYRKFSVMISSGSGGDGKRSLH